MNHDLVRQLFHPFLTGQVTPERHQQVLEHVRLCPECERDLLAYADLLESLSILSDDCASAPLNFSSGVMRQLRRPSAREVAFAAVDTGITYSTAISAGLITVFLVGSTMFWKHSLETHCAVSSFGGSRLSLDCASAAGVVDAIEKCLQVLAGTFGSAVVFSSFMLSAYAALRRRTALASLVLCAGILAGGTHLAAQASLRASVLQRAIVSVALFESNAESRAQILQDLFRKALDNSSRKGPGAGAKTP